MLHTTGDLLTPPELGARAICRYKIKSSDPKMVHSVQTYESRAFVQEPACFFNTPGPRLKVPYLSMKLLLVVEANVFVTMKPPTVVSFGIMTAPAV